MRLLIAILVPFLIVGCVPAGEDTPSDSSALLVKQVQGSYDLAQEWLRSNMRENGLFHYIYDVDQDLYPDKNNAIRQLMASRLIAELSQEDSMWIPMHRKNLDFIFKNWYREEGDIGYIFYNNKSKLGANAMALRALVFSPFFSNYELQAQRLAMGILSLLHTDGSFDPWLKEPSYDYDAD